ncbi:MAG: MerR family transcriptional regulator [Actinobacteria bacterium]|nr:MerR family transcriptional regulator [Actinomycetota bacterium]
MSPRAFLSIGDVLSALREEFPDVTISKIRFLESQGLVNPQRSPSGYRKFYANDVKRLRWVLRQQREHFLPLKVIRDRLEEADASGTLDEVTSSDLSASLPTSLAKKSDAGAEAYKKPKTRQSNAHLHATTVLAGGVSMTREEICAAAGISQSELSTLESMRLVESMTLAGQAIYDEAALVVCRLAAAFAGFGLEPRHLRLYRNAVDREIGMAEQIVAPLLRQRNPESRVRAAEDAGELERLGQAMRSALFGRDLRKILGSLGG